MENDKTNVTAEGVQAVEDVAKEGTAKASETAEINIPKSRFDEVNNKYKEAKAQLDKLAETQAAEALKQKEKQGEFESLYTQTKETATKLQKDFDGTKARAEALEGVINSMLTEKLEAIPEDLKDIVPEGLAPEATLKWLTQAESKGLFKAKAEQPLGGVTNPTGKSTIDTSKLNSMDLLKMGYGK